VDENDDELAGKRRLGEGKGGPRRGGATESEGENVTGVVPPPPRRVGESAEGRGGSAASGGGAGGGTGPGSEAMDSLRCCVRAESARA